jgi:hypothetical protein
MDQLPTDFEVIQQFLTQLTLDAIEIQMAQPILQSGLLLPRLLNPQRLILLSQVDRILIQKYEATCLNIKAL